MSPIEMAAAAAMVVAAWAYSNRKSVGAWLSGGTATAPASGGADPLDAFIRILADEAQAGRYDEVKAEIRAAASKRLGSVPLATAVVATPNPAAGGEPAAPK